MEILSRKLTAQTLILMCAINFVGCEEIGSTADDDTHPKTDNNGGDDKNGGDKLIITPENAISLLSEVVQFDDFEPKKSSNSINEQTEMANFAVAIMSDKAMVSINGGLLSSNSHLFNAKREIYISDPMALDFDGLIALEQITSQVITTTTDCENFGSIETVFTDRNGDGIFNDGETGTERYRICDGDGIRQNGDITIELGSVRYNDNGEVSYFDGSFTYSNYSLGDSATTSTYNGDIYIIASSIGETGYSRASNGNSLEISTVSRGAENFTYRYTNYFTQLKFMGRSANDEYSIIQNYTYTSDSSAVAGASLTVSTSPRFVGEEGDPPRSGSLTVRTETSSIKLSAIDDDTAKLLIDQDLDGVFEYEEVLSWYDIETIF